MTVEPCLESTAHEGFTDSVPFDDGADEHDNSRENGGEADAHLVENDACKNKKKGPNVEEHLGALHAAKRGRVPAACFLHQVLDRGENVHEDITAKHG